MASHFKWVLTCWDDNTQYTLSKDPIGYGDCSFRMERHSVYRGIFNQFTSNLRFHNDGGGKQFVDLKYVTYDINGRIDIEVLVDSDGKGLNYETLFIGKLNLASYQSDTIHTSVNIEQSDIATKLNTRADISVPINVPLIEVPGQPTFKAVYLQEYLSGENSGVTTGVYIFNNPNIIKGVIYKVVTVDVDNNNVVDTVTFNTNGQSGAGSASGATTLQITDVQDGSLEVTFANIFGSIELDKVGSQISLGQQPIKPIDTKLLTLNGIPIFYQSQFKVRGEINSGTHDFDGIEYADKIASGHTITAYAIDISGGEIFDEINYTGTYVPGPGGKNGRSEIRISNIVSGVVSVDYLNTYDGIELWIDGDFADIYIPVSTDAVQHFSVQGNTLQATGGLITFDTDTVFDNLNEFALFKGDDLTFSPVANTEANSLTTPIFDGFTEPYVKYPVSVDYHIIMEGTVLDVSSAPIERNVNLKFKLAYGQTLDTAIKIEFQYLIYADNPGPVAFSFDEAGTIALTRGDKIWLYVLYDSLGGNFIDIDFNFSRSLINFELSVLALPTTAPTILVHDAFMQVTDMLADTDGNFYSEFYGRTNSQKRQYAGNGEGSARALAGGFCIRGRLDKYISMSLSELFKSMSAIDNLGMEIDPLNRLRVEKLAYFFDKDTKITTLPKVFNYDTLNENSYYFNQIQAGYDKWETEIYFKGGLNEVHGKRYYATRVATAKGSVLQRYGSAGRTGVNNSLEIISKFIAGNYAIELTRRKNKEWSTDDFKYDNDNFIICLSNKLRAQVSFTEPDIVAVYENDFTQVLNAGDTFTVSGGTANDGTYTVVSVEFNGDSTAITVAESVTAGLRVYVNLDLPDLVPETAVTLLSEDITNIVRPDLAKNWLNMAITPGRMLQNAFNKITAGLQKIRGNVQFLDGEGNYLAVTKFRDTGTERQQDYSNYALGENFNISHADNNVRNVTPLWVPEIYRFEYPLTYAQFKAIRANPNGYIEFYKFEGQAKKGFILSMDYLFETGMTKFELLKVFDPDILLWESENSQAVADEEGNIIELDRRRP